MTHFLRNRNNDTLVDLDELGEDFSVVVDIEHYSKILLDLGKGYQNEFMEDMSFLQELRGYWFEVIHHSNPEANMREFIKGELEAVGKQWNLYYITD